MMSGNYVANGLPARTQAFNEIALMSSASAIESWRAENRLRVFTFRDNLITAAIDKQRRFGAEELNPVISSPSSDKTAARKSVRVAAGVGECESWEIEDRLQSIGCVT